MAWNDRLSLKAPAKDAAQGAAAAYRYAIDKLIADLEDRMGRFTRGAAFGGNASDLDNTRIMAELRESIRQLEAALAEVAPEVAEYASNRVAGFVTPRQEAWLAGMVADAPAGARVRVATVLNRAERYIRSGSVLRANLADGIQPIHHRLVNRVERVMVEGMASGETFGQIVTRMERDVFGVNYLKGEKHPAIPRADGTVMDSTYGMRKGYAKPTNPRGVIGDVERLVKTEMSSAYHEGRRDAVNDLRNEGLIIGIHIEPELHTDYGLDCPVCGPILESATGEGPGDFLFADGEPPQPPYHPNCECSETNAIWAG